MDSMMIRIAVYEHRYRPGPRDRQRCGYERIDREDYFISSTNLARSQHDLECVSAVRHTDTVTRGRLPPGPNFNVR